MPGLVTLGLGTGGVIGAPGLVTMGMGANAPIPANAFNLITAEYAANVLAAAGFAMTTEQQTILPSLITAASKEIERYCNRPFVLLNYDEIATPEGGRQDRGEPASFMLSRHPVRSISRAMTSRATALLVANTDSQANQYASVQFAMIGDEEYLDLQYTGLLLNRMSNGTPSTVILTFASYATIQLMADAINALGHGWQATIQSNGVQPNVGMFPSADLVCVREPKNALGQGVGLDLFMQAAGDYDIDRSTGIVRVYGRGGLNWGGFGGWCDPYGASWDGLGGYGGGQLGWSQYRISYQAGYETIPQDVQLICAELVQNSFQRLSRNPYITQETMAGAEHSISFSNTVAPLSDDMRRQLAKYKDWTV